MSLIEQVALVTGGTSGIGEAACHALADEDATVIATDKQLEAAKKFASSLPPTSANECEANFASFHNNNTGAILVTRTAGREMTHAGKLLPEGGAAIINISIMVAKSGWIAYGAYSAGKAGVVSLTKSAAQELAAHGIRCNAVLPVWTETAKSTPLPEHTKAEVLSIVPLRRPAQPMETAEAVKFLCSPKTSSYITGAAPEVTGGCKM
ncbi:hypothetical protein HPB50_025668 [Hyalomma asiaticum]|uniref:Uncharacterized protein n=1 Tax=Hyalomma asiaticum TaxID=266040 RepID=A0ACB7SA68_HYAAI|nr:hypothetical protein HPB50_025668 [Hyalomma asiaticum]